MYSYLNVYVVLSALPISDSSISTPLKKSLLFHPRVAEEANNLLSRKDEVLSKQLTAALEQTNADHMYVFMILIGTSVKVYYFVIFFLFASELKPQYAEQQPSITNINELPILLQMIQHRKPNVFKTGGQQFQHHKQRMC